MMQRQDPELVEAALSYAAGRTGHWRVLGTEVQALQEENLRLKKLAHALKPPFLTAVEERLADRCGLTHDHDISDRLAALDRANKLVEDEVVAEWHELYAHYLEGWR